MAEPFLIKLRMLHKAGCDLLKKLTGRLFQINSIWENPPVNFFKISHQVSFKNLLKKVLPLISKNF